MNWNRLAPLQKTSSCTYIGTVRRKIFFTATFQPFSAFHGHFAATHGHKFFTAIQDLKRPLFWKVAMITATWQACNLLYLSAAAGVAWPPLVLPTPATVFRPISPVKKYLYE